MEDRNDVQSVRAYLERVWDKPVPTDTEISLFRGQLNNYPLFPKLFRTPNTPDRVRETESKMLAFLKQASPHLLPSQPTNDWEWLSLGQHYGMSTRMSDWSANPLVALFFAVELDPRAQASPRVYHYPIRREIIEMLKEDSPLTIHNTRVFQPHHSHRSEAQAAWHVVHAIHSGDDGQPHFYSLDSMPPHKGRIDEIKIDKAHVAAIRNELSRMGMTHSTIYGDFGSVCRSIAPSFGLS